MTKETTSTIRPELLDELLQGCSAMLTQEELFGPDGVVKHLANNRWTISLQLLTIPASPLYTRAVFEWLFTRCSFPGQERGKRC